MHFPRWKVLYDLAVKYYCTLIIAISAGELNVFHKMRYRARPKHGVFGCRCFETLNSNAKTIDYATTFRRLEAMALCQLTDS